MIYDIQSKSDLSGIMLTVRFPEEDLDKKALYTIQADQPEFLVPFRYRNVDGEIECVYQLGSRSKLQYRSGSHTPDQYIAFWNQLLKPLLDCGDWFLKPFSFVLDARYLYIDKGGKTISYLYIPSRRDCSDGDALKELVLELSHQNSVTDPKLENKVLHAIMQDFQPKDFLQMLRVNQPAPIHSSVPESARYESPEIPSPVSFPSMPVNVGQAAQAAVNAGTSDNSNIPAGDKNDIAINLGGQKKQKEKKTGLFEKKKPAKKGGFFGRKEKKADKEVILGAAAESVPHEVRYAPGQPGLADVWMQPEGEDAVTELEDDVVGVVHLRLIGDTSLPHQIPVLLELGQIFTIGRFDVSVGHPQSSFEFDKRTKAVSRRHAAIERQQDGSYVIVDLSSSAGTFVDGQRLTPNVPALLARGKRISFGTGGADYVWEE